MGLAALTIVLRWLDRGLIQKFVNWFEVVGHIGRVHPELIKRLDLPEHTFVFECRVQDLLRRPLPTASEVSRFPEIRRDIAMLVPTAHSALDIIQSIQNVAGEVLTNLKLFDVYQGKGIDPTRKSLAFRLTFQHISRNLTDEEISQIVIEIVAALKQEFDAEQR